MTYSEKLTDPRWQRKRLDIMKRDDFACVNCGDRLSTLNVHHGYYERGLDPWEYPDETLHTLCEICHKQAYEADLVLRRLIGEMLNLEQITGYAKGIILQGSTDKNFSVTLYGAEDTCGLGDCFGVSDETIQRAIYETNGVLDGHAIDKIKARKSDCIALINRFAHRRHLQ